MAAYFFDTSALTKHYQVEAGSAKVDAILAATGADHSISRLGFVEFYSTFAKKCRIGVVSRGQFEAIVRSFRADVRSKRFEVVRLTNAHYDFASRLIRRLGPVQNLRTLDALQLAVALSLNEPGRPVTFVCADHALCEIAAAEGLAVMNPEVP
jgi:predicted nucleic acid-binding protein